MLEIKMLIVQLISLIGLTHFAMDGVAVTVNRCLAKNHPIFRLLAPHFLYLFAIDKYD